MTERELVCAYLEARGRKKEAESNLKALKTEFNKIEFELFQHLDDIGAEATASYEGLGRVQEIKPIVYAQAVKEKERELFNFLDEVNRKDLIKETVNASSLSSFVSERIENGESIPECISYYLKRSLRVY